MWIINYYNYIIRGVRGGAVGW
jgi:hypothetical protein